MSTEKPHSADRGVVPRLRSGPPQFRGSLAEISDIRLMVRLLLTASGEYSRGMQPFIC